MRSKPIERGMTQRVFMAPLRLMMNIQAVRIARKDVSIHAGNAEALCVGMEKDFLDAGKYGEVMEFSGSDRSRQTFGEGSSIVGYCV